MRGARLDVPGVQGLVKVWSRCGQRFGQRFGQGVIRVNVISKGVGARRGGKGRIGET